MDKQLRMVYGFVELAKGGSKFALAVHNGSFHTRIMSWMSCRHWSR